MVILVNILLTLAVLARTRFVFQEIFHERAALRVCIPAVVICKAVRTLIRIKKLP